MTNQMLPEPLLTPRELVRLRVLCDAAVENISRGLTGMFGATMRVTALDVRTVPLAQVGALLGDPEMDVIGVYLGSQGLFAAHLLLVIPAATALQLCDILLEQPVGETLEFGELECSALCEMGNVAGSFFLNALGESTGNTLMITPPVLLHDMAGAAIAAILLDVAATADETITIDAGFEHEGRSLPAWFLTFPEPAQLHDLLLPLSERCLMTMQIDLVIPVGLGELRVAAGEAAVFLALGLGSCVGVAIWDATNQVGGMAHIVLPAPLNASVAASNKFANSAVPELVRAVVARGARKRQLCCVIAGGADVLSAGTLKNLFHIGERNTAAVLEALALEGLRPREQDCGGKTGRSFRLVLPEGRVAVRRLGADWRDM